MCSVGRELKSDGYDVWGHRALLPITKLKTEGQDKFFKGFSYIPQSNRNELILSPDLALNGGFRHLPDLAWRLITRQRVAVFDA